MMNLCTCPSEKFCNGLYFSEIKREILRETQRDPKHCAQCLLAVAAGNKKILKIHDNFLASTVHVLRNRMGDKILLEKMKINRSTCLRTINLKNPCD